MGATKVWTDDELMRLPEDGYKYELVDGALVVSPAGGRHGRTIVRLTLRLGGFVVPRGLGEVFDSSTGYRLPGGNLRVPDLSFVATARLPGGRAPVGFLYVAPDLAVEVPSPDDRPRVVADKVVEYLAVGVRLVWVIDPETERATVHRADGITREIPASGALGGEDVLPGSSAPWPTSSPRIPARTAARRALHPFGPVAGWSRGLRPCRGGPSGGGRDSRRDGLEEVFVEGHLHGPHRPAS